MLERGKHQNLVLDILSNLGVEIKDSLGYGLASIDFSNLYEKYEKTLLIGHCFAQYFLSDDIDLVIALDKRCLDLAKSVALKLSLFSGNIRAKEIKSSYIHSINDEYITLPNEEIAQMVTDKKTILFVGDFLIPKDETTTNIIRASRQKGWKVAGVGTMLSLGEIHEYNVGFADKLVVLAIVPIHPY
jgi:adenine/guanine phosphoribosyltransferase-like PRPP-binding protein